MTEAQMAGASLDAPAASRSQIVSAAIASVLGWSLDLFDLFILLYVAPVVGALFFPSTHPTWSLAAVYASFAVTLMVRPVGSAIFGHYADTRGRKGAMLTAIVGVGLSTAAFGLLPTLAQVGVLAPISFLALRLVQGVFVGGVVASTHTIGTESAPPQWRGLMSGLIGGGGAGLGALFASFVFLIASALFPGDAFAQWGWRFMFFSGLLSALLGWFVFNSLEESPHFRALQARKGRSSGPSPGSPLKLLFGAYRWTFLLNLLLSFGGGAGYYLTAGYLPTFLKVVNHIPNRTSSLILMCCSVCALFAAILVGALSDFIGRRRTFLLSGLVAILALPLLYLNLAASTSMTTTLLWASAIAFIGNACYAPLLIFLNERFPTEVRASGTGLSWNVGFALGGMTPIFVSLLSGGASGLPRTLGYFIAAVYFMLLIGAAINSETKGKLT